MYQRLWLCFWLWLGPFAVLAQEAPVRFAFLTREQGLSQNTVHAIHQDQFGFLWLATEDGLNRYDGYTFKVFRHQPEDMSSLSSSFIVDIVEDRGQNMWLLTSKGLDRYDHRRQSFTRYTPSRTADKIMANLYMASFFSDRHGRFVVATPGEFWVYQPESDGFTPLAFGLEKLEEITGYQFRRFFSRDDGFLWSVAAGRLFRFEIDTEKKEGPASWSSWQLSTGDSGGGQPNRAGHVHFDRQFLWASTDKGLFRVTSRLDESPEIRHFPRSSHSQGHGWGHRLATDKQGKIWVSTGTGLDLFDPLTGAFDLADKGAHQSRYSLPHEILDLYVDNAGILWAGTDGGGIVKIQLKGNPFFTYRPGEPFLAGEDMIRAIVEEDDGNLLVGTDRGLSRLNFQSLTFERPTLAQSLDPLGAGLRVRALLKDPRGDLWLGTHKGLMRWQAATQSLRRFHRESRFAGSPMSKEIRTVYQDRSGYLWLGTHGHGLVRYHPETDHYENFLAMPNESAALQSNFVNVFLQDSAGTLWIGTSEGLHRWDETGNRVVREGLPQPGANQQVPILVVDLWEAPRGSLWLATVGDGLHKIDLTSGQRRSFTRANGLPSDSVTTILEDPAGYFWLGTSNGLSRMDPRTESFRNFSVQDGIQSLDFNAGAAWQSPNGCLFLGGADGLTGFTPYNIQRDEVLPAVALTDLRIFNRPTPILPTGTTGDPDAFVLPEAIETIPTLSLSYKESMFSITFAALHFANPNQNRYAYRLVGFDDHWIETTAAQRMATYTNLSPGTYEFQVKASNHDGIWNPASRDLTIVIRPPLWQSPGAMALYAFVLLGLLATAYHLYRRRRLQEKREIARLRHLDQLTNTFLGNTYLELCTPLNGMIGLAESLLDKDPKEASGAREKALEVIIDHGRKLSGMIRDILDFCQLHNRHVPLHKQPVDLHMLTDMVFASAAPQAVQRQVTLVNRIQRGSHMVMAEPNRIQQVLQALVYQCLTLTEKGTITLDAALKGRQLTISVTDSSAGIPEAQQAEIFQPFAYLAPSQDAIKGDLGLSLAIAHKLVALHGGTLRLATAPEGGNQFSFSLLHGLDPCPEPGARLDALAPPPTTDQLESLNPGQGIGLPKQMRGARPAPRIMIVGSNASHRQMRANQLSLAGYDTHQCTHGRQASHLIAKDLPVDLVLLDWDLPEMCGLATCKAIRAHRAQHELPIILITNRKENHDLGEAFRNGANDYFIEPIEQAEFLVRIKTQIDLYRINRHLENEVAQRTRQLADKHNELEEAYEQVRHQAEQLQQQDAIKSRFFTYLAHEFRTPLSLIIAPLEDLLEEQKLPEHEEVLLQLMSRNAQRLLSLVNQILEISKLEAGEVALDRQTVDLETFFRDCVAPFRAHARQRGITIQLTCPGASGFSLDPEKVEMVVTNILANAFKYSGDDSPIALEVSPAQHHLNVRIRDWGTGIAADQIPFVFNRFHRDPGEKLSTSSGIGLALAKELVELMGGTIDVESKPGQGSTFTIQLPPLAPDATDPPASERDPSLRLPFLGEHHSSETNKSPAETPQGSSDLTETDDLAADHILIIEDDREIRHYLVHHLAADFVISETGNGQQGLQMAFEEIPNLILCDVMLPGMDGLALCSQLKQDERTNHIPVLMLTAKASLEHKIAGLRTGADDYLVKPFHYAELRTRIDNLIASRKAVQQRLQEQVILSPSPINVDSSDEAFLRKAIDLVEQHLDNPRFGVLELADEMALSRRQLLRKLNGLTGLSSSDFIKKIRVQRAAQLLLQRAGTIKEIAYMVGFKNPSHFAKVFRELMGLTPKEYMQQTMAQPSTGSPS